MIFFYRICQLLLSAANLVNLIYDIYITDEFVTHIFIGYEMSAYIRKIDGIYISVSQKRLNMDDKNRITELIAYLRNNTCSFTILNAVFILKAAV